MIKSDLVRRMNEDYAQLELDAARIEELPVELEQLRKAMEAANARVDFDVDPHDFRTAQLEIAAGAKND